MAWFLPALAVSSLIELRCPKCRKPQLRARKAKDAVYRCKFCHAKFKRGESAR